MIRTIIFSLFILLSFSSCLKSSGNSKCEYDACGVVAPANEIADVQAYLTANSITGAVQHCSGVFYKIESAGSGAKPTPCSYINANYTGKLTNGNVFDQGSFPQLYQLKGLIRGWTNTVPLIQNGGKIHLYIPPTLGYGNSSVSSIPPNSILIFDIELTVVQ
jgi:FKBP-type peptidyl-prolyl cis-trans isomerase FkpA